MKILPIQQVANQSFSAVLDNNQWDISLRATNGVMAASLTLNGVVVLDNMRVVAGMRVIPSLYEEAGNFVFITANGELPDYTKFGVTQSLYYFSAAELAAIRTPTPSPITAAYFNPLGDLPLRFAPQGYVVAP